MTQNTEKVNAIIAYFKKNTELFNDCIEELDGWNGYLGDDRYYYMEELDEIYNGVDPLELLRRAYYGWDEDSWTEDGHGHRRHDEFNPNREYFRFNGYGNLVSTDYKDYSDHLDAYTVEDMSERRKDIYCIDEDDELCALFDALEESEAE